MTLDDILNTNLGVTLAFAITWGAAVWAYKKNVEDHSRLGDKVDDARDELAISIDKLGEKIDAVREAISHHEAIWHASVRTNKKSTTKTNKGRIK